MTLEAQRAATTSSASAVPAHVAIIMDGNGRWAERRGLPRLAGHKAGTENVRRILKAMHNGGVRYVSLFAFSTENWGKLRPVDVGTNGNVYIHYRIAR